MEELFPLPLSTSMRTVIVHQVLDLIVRDVSIKIIGIDLIHLNIDED